MPQPFIETLPLQQTCAVITLCAIAGELFLQRRQFCEWRIGIGRTIALARCRAAVAQLTVRGTAVALVAAALVASAEITACRARPCRDHHSLSRSPLLRDRICCRGDRPRDPCLRSARGEDDPDARCWRALGRRCPSAAGGGCGIRRCALAAAYETRCCGDRGDGAARAARFLAAFARGSLRAVGRAAVMTLAVAVVMRTALVGSGHRAARLRPAAGSAGGASSLASAATASAARF